MNYFINCLVAILLLIFPITAKCINNSPVLRSLPYNDTLVFSVFYSNYNNQPSYDFPTENDIVIEFYNCGGVDETGISLLMDCMDIVWKKNGTRSYGKMQRFEIDILQSSSEQLYELGADEVVKNIFDWDYKNSYDSKSGKAIVWMKIGFHKEIISLVEIEVESKEGRFLLLGFPILHH